jgi:uncharacterized protein YndB with AHSA1/START domain
MSARKRDGTDGTVMSLPSDEEILITRAFAAPARIVFAVLTKPEHIRRWWAPASRGKMTQCDVDFRIGGAWRFVMRTNGGLEVGFSGRYLEIEAPTRVVQTEIFDPFPDAPSTVTLTLVEQAGVTTMTSRIRYPSRAIRDQVIATGMEDGMRESYQQLSAAVGELAEA